MRKISQGPIPHNVGHLFLRARGLALLALIGLSVLGCGSKDTQKQAAAAAECPAILDLSGWTGFCALGDQLIAGQAVSRPQLEAYGNLPAVALWRESMGVNSPAAFKVGNWVEFAFWDEVGQGRQTKMNENRSSFGKAFRFGYDHRLEINTQLNLYQDEGHPCRVFATAEYWIEEENLPDPFVIRVIAGKPEIRCHNGNLLVDPSVLLAGGSTQLDRQLCAILYRDRQALKGESPLDLEGSAAVASVLRIMMNEGLAAWIEDLPQTHFSSAHPRLAKVAVVPEQIFETGIRAIDIFNTNLPDMLTNPAAMERKGEALARAITGAGAFTRGGYCMAAVIAHRLGQERLKLVRTSPPAFLEAFQEAALQNTTPLPKPGAPGHELFETMPALSDEVYSGLLSVLETHYPR